MACNSDKDTKIFTISLPPKLSDGAKYRVGAGEKNYVVPPDETGTKFKNTKYEHQIEQILRDSASFDHKRFDGKIDFVFIDGSHTYEYVKNDTLKAFDMINDSGLILWHDYAENSFGVPKFLSELSSNHDLYNIIDTSFVIKLPKNSRKTVL